MKGFCIEVSGDFACFTRPETKVERMSYEVITPSAARAIFEAIFWQPAIRWRITRIEVLNPIRWTNIRRNEVKSVASQKSTGIYIEDDRVQRHSLVLRDVRYRIYGEFDMVDRYANSAKYAAMFERRAAKGQYFTHPYLGCREFACREVRLISDPAKEVAKPINETRDLGFVLYDKDYSDRKDIRPMIYHAQMVNGTIIVPHPDSQEVLR